MSWVETEFETIDFGDRRLDRRAINILDTLGLAPGRTIPQTFQAWGEIKACYNFFDNPLVTDEKLLAPHIERTIERLREYPVVLFLSDTTEIDYTAKEMMKGKERLSNKKNGLWLHPVIAVTPERLTLGILDANFWSRDPEVAESSSAYRTARDKAPIEEKESYRWLQGYRKACEIAEITPGTQIIHITDREGDIIEIFEEAEELREQGKGADFIIRSQYDRRIEDQEDETNKKLRQKLKESTSLGKIEFIIPARGNRKKRKVKQQLRAISATLNRKGLKVSVNAIMAIETDPPEGEEALVWVFITSLPIGTFDNLKAIIIYYLCRWEIELFFKVLKSGCKIEERQLQTTDRMKRLIALFMILAWRVMFTMMLGRVCGEMSCGDLFDVAEWKSVYKVVNKKKALPRKPPRLDEFVVMLATLGGYVENGKEPPGVKTMWKGMARMVDFSIAWEAFGG